ncbi:MAG: 50S ribosomal protein L9 [Acidobacteriota bacterium]
MAHMDVLLCEDVDNLGQRGQVVRVRTGYGRNYLLPQGLAINATAGNKKMIDEQRRVLAKREERERQAAQSESERLNGLELRFERRVGESGILFGSVTALDIVEALKAQGYEIERRRVALKEPIKETGEFEVVIKLHREVTPTVKVSVRREGGEEAPAETAAATEAAPVADSTADEATTEAAEVNAAEATEATETAASEEA